MALSLRDDWYECQYPKLCDTEGSVYWMKAMKALMITKREVLPLVKSVFIEFCNNCDTNERANLQPLLDMASNRHGYKQVFRVKKPKLDPNYVWGVNCSKCRPLLQKLLRSHWNPARIEWENIGSVNVDDYWKIAKLFMPYGNKDSTGPEDADMLAIFELLRTFKIDNFEQEIKLLNQLISDRNLLVHSPTYEIKQEKMNEMFENIFDFLKSNRLGDTTIAMTELQQLQKNIINKGDPIYRQCLQIQRMGLEFDEQEGDRRDELMEKINQIAKELNIAKFSKDRMQSEINELTELLKAKNTEIVDKSGELSTMRTRFEQIEKESPGLVDRIIAGTSTGGVVGAFGGPLGVLTGGAGGGVVGGLSYIWDKFSRK